MTTSAAAQNMDCQLCGSLPVTLPRLLQLGIHPDRGAVLYQCPSCHVYHEAQPGVGFKRIAKQEAAKEYPSVDLERGI